ncbi:hypothetical protein IK146_03155 [Candidatus Saccharibacteria bacterium]|nr:hypothetical protein [Candidatus Saccharibacteria bacterium]
MTCLRRLFRSIIQTIRRRKQLREELKRNYEECERLVKGIKDDYEKECESILKAYNEKLKEIGTVVGPEADAATNESERDSRRALALTDQKIKEVRENYGRRAERIKQAYGGS